MLQAIPTSEVLEMQKKNMSHEQIVDYLHQKGYNSQQIMDAINQAELNQQASPFDTEGSTYMGNQGFQDQQLPDLTAPAPGINYEQPQFQQQRFQPSPRNVEEQIEEIAEAIVDEKWEELTKDIGNISLWKESVQTEVESVKQEILRLEGRLEKLQNAVLGKVEDYNKTLNEVNTEMQALSKVFEKIIEPLTTNIKELSRITSDLKNKK